jgi:uncharacterized membrane protein YkoI
MRHYSKSLLAAAVFFANGAAAYAGNPAIGEQHSVPEPFKGENLAKDARITMADARIIALKARPGRITDEELEKEKGGSGLRYSFDMDATKGKYEVGIDAVTGKVLENKIEGPNPD